MRLTATHLVWALLIDPEREEPADIHDFTEPDWPLWTMHEAMGDRTQKRIEGIERHFRLRVEHAIPDGHPSFWEEIADVWLWCAVRHPDTPFGIGARRRGRQFDPANTMTVRYHDQFYRRDARGILHPLHRQAADALGREGWFVAQQVGLALHDSYQWLEKAIGQQAALDWLDHEKTALLGGGS